MKNHLSSYLDNAITLVILVVAGLTPLFFLNQTTEFFDTPKLIFLVIATAVLLGLWIFSWIIKGKVVITRTPLDIPLLILLVVAVISTFFSTARYASLYGNFPTVNGSVVSWVTYILLYFVTVSHLKNIARIKTFLYVLYASALVVSVFTFLSFFHLFLPFDFAKTVNFTPTGSSFSTIAFLLLLLPLPLFSIITPNKYMPVPLALAVAIIFSVIVVLIGSIPTYVALGIVYALCVFVAKPNLANKDHILFVIPPLVTIIVLVLAYLPFPGNALQQMEFNFPKEIQLPFTTSWSVSISAFRDAPFIGTGPSTFSFDFSTYKPVAFNLLPFWNISFENAYNEFFQVLATLGIFGFLALVLLVLVIINNSRKNFSLNADDEHQYNMHVISAGLAVSGLVSIVLLAIHAMTLVSFVMTLFMLAALMMSQKSVREKVMEFSMGLKASTSDNKQFDLFPIIIFIVYLIAIVPVFYQAFNAVAADYYHRQALLQANKSGTATYQDLQKAESLNPQIALYRVDMAQTNFALANALVLQKGPTQKNPQGSLSNQDKQTIQTLLAQAVNEGRAGVILSPRSPQNWTVLGSIYRNIAGVAQNALVFALDAYSQAIQRDPMNPVLRLNVGGIYYAAKNYDQAIRFFTDAANLKPDYANAYYNLSIAYRDKGDVQNALAVAQQTVTILQKNGATNTPDYKVATELVKDLQSKAATSQQQSAQNNQQQAPAAQTESALQNSNISNVNVPNLNNPPQPTIPAAVKKNPDTNIPQPTTATPSPAAKK